MDPTAPPGNSNGNDNPTGPVTTEPINPPSAAPPRPQGISATALDPNDPLVGQNPPQNPVDNSILPGQYVVSGASENPPPASSNPFAAPIPAPAEPFAQPLPSVQTPLAGEVPAAPPPLPPTPTAPPESIAETSTSTAQPDPTPYTPPPASASAQSANGGQMIKKLRLVAIVLGVVVLLIVVGLLVWFLVLSKNGQAPTKVENEPVSTLVVEPTPVPQKPGAGFSSLPALPQSTSSASQATSSAR